MLTKNGSFQQINIYIHMIYCRGICSLPPTNSLINSHWDVLYSYVTYFSLCRGILGSGNISGIVCHMMKYGRSCNVASVQMIFLFLVTVLESRIKKYWVWYRFSTSMFAISCPRAQIFILVLLSGWQLLTKLIPAFYLEWHFFFVGILFVSLKRI